MCVWTHESAAAGNRYTHHLSGWPIADEDKSINFLCAFAMTLGSASWSEPCLVDQWD
jgi:hypothetical protein